MLERPLLHDWHGNSSKSGVLAIAMMLVTRVGDNDGDGHDCEGVGDIEEGEGDEDEDDGDLGQFGGVEVSHIFCLQCTP